MEIGRLWVTIGAKISEFESAIKKMETDITRAEKKFSSFSKVGDRLAGMGKSLMFGVTMPVAGAGAAMIKFAMDAVESESLFEVSMGNMAGAARTWSEQLSQALGLNDYELRRNVGTFNVMFTAMGLGEQAAYDMSTGLTQLAYDMASFYNMKPEEAFDKLRAGITGETEPLKRLGILVDENTVKHYAMKNGIGEAGKELTQTQKVMARYGAIIEQTSKSQGDLARTLDSPANKLRVLTSRLQETATTLGIQLLPAVNDALSSLTKLVERFQNLNPATQKAILIFGGLAAALGPVLWMLGSVLSLVPKLAEAFTLLKIGVLNLGKSFIWLATNPIGLIVLGIAGAIAAGVALYKNWDAVKYYGIQAWSNLKEYVLSAINSMLGAFEKLLGWIPAVGDKIRQARAGVGSIITKEQAQQSARAAEYEATQIEKEANKVKETVKDAQASFDMPYDVKLPVDAFEDFGDAAKGAGEKAAKAADDTRTQWEKTADVLNNRLDILKAKYDTASIVLGENASETEKLTLKLNSLKQQYAVQEQVVSNAEAAYNAAKNSKKANSEELGKLQLNLERARTEEARMDAELRQTKEALDEQALGLDGLNYRLNVVNKRYDIAKTKLGENAAETEKLAVDQLYLTQQLDLQNQMVAKLTKQYEDVTAVKGEDSKASQELNIKLLDAQKAQADLENNLRTTTDAIADQAKKLEEHKAKVKDAATAYRQDLAKALDDYQSKVAEVNKKLADDEAKLTEEYQNEVSRRAQALTDWVGLFDAVPERAQVSGQQLLANLRGQVDAFKAWQELISQLAARGIDQGLLAELQQMGPKASGELAALLTLTDEELAQYVALWQEKNQLAYAQAASELEGLRVETEAKIAELRANAAVQLEQYRQEWEEKNKEIRENTVAELKKLVEEAGKLGSAFVLAVAEGIKASMPELAAAFADLPGFTLVSDATQVEAQAKSTVAAAEQQKTGVLTATSEQKTGVLQTWAEIGAQLAAKNTEINTLTITSWQQLQQQLFALWQKILQDATATWTNMQKLVFAVTGQIESRFTTLESAATNWGRNLMNNFIAGIWSQYDRLVETLQTMMETAQAYLGFASPAEKGPGRHADEWGPGLVKTLVEGIKAEMPKLETVSAEVVAAIRTPVVNVSTPAAVTAGGNTIIVNINGAQDPEAIWAYLERKLILAGVR